MVSEFENIIERHPNHGLSMTEREILYLYTWDDVQEGLEERQFRKDCRDGNLQAVIKAVESGHDIHCCSQNPLGEALVGGQLEVVKYLLTKGADLEYLLVHDKYFAKVLEARHFHMINFLLEECNVDPNVSGREISFLLLLHEDVEQYLDYFLKFGLRIEFAFAVTASEGWLDDMKMLEEKYNVDTKHTLPIACKCSVTSNIELVQYLLEKYDYSKDEDIIRDSLIASCECGDVDVWSILFDTFPEYVKEFVEKCIDVAIMSKSSKIVNHLLENGYKATVDESYRKKESNNRIPA
ncbi:hypothetical protein ROZALSC1DRAFT_30123, partial [Rozella allomycis CSF55]